MNTVKYRAWMPKEKKWYKGGAIQLTALQGNTFGLSEANGKIVQLQQWTGLTDRHGVEIYEGDIIKLKETVLSDTEEPDYPHIETKRDNMFVYANGKTGLRIWGHELINVDNRFGTHSDDWTDYYGYESPTEIQGGEVIGNIWEHGHLLENESKK